MSVIELNKKYPLVRDENNTFFEEWKRWCRLCAKAEVQCINALTGHYTQSTLASDNYNSLNILAAIDEFFHVQIKEDEKLSPFVCTECFDVVTSFVKFNDNVKKVQQLYHELLHSDDKTKLNLPALYARYGLCREETILTQTSSSKVPVEEIFIADSPVPKCANLSIQIKNERCDEFPAEEFINEFEKKEEFQDPFGEEEEFTDLKTRAPVNDDDNSRSEDFNLPMDTEDTDDEDEEVCTKNKINNDSVESEDSTDIAKETAHTCGICLMSFHRRCNYSVHVKKKHSKHLCRHCPSLFDSKPVLKEHMKDHRQLFPCPHCDRKFVTKEYVSQHIKFIHDDERPFICETCGDAVRTKGQLKEHMLTHTDYSPFECKECGKCFKQKQRLKRHMQIHGDKHICTECGKQLSTRATLNSHLLVHSDKMPHKCDYCGRLFKRAKTLKNHLIAHTGLRPYSCDFCDKTFSTGPSCRFHKKTMHPVELAALEASGVKTYTKNIPNLDVLKAVSRTAENLTPLASKQNGYATFDRKKEPPKEDVEAKPNETVMAVDA
ncbi:zinc finger protein weckle-like [Bactrocera dorsalis]|uniref:Zinc finger protein weckle n=1 Tax=Bactrocera dorsalis TaxID=27457 RepID=A0A034V7K8_BACDO|nr:zinc finger protein weckle-like [Bactrocera dorsalis]